MPRGNNNNAVGVARFYDWSDQDRTDHVSVSRLYREIAGSGPKAAPSRTQSERVRPRPPGCGQWLGPPPGASPRARLNPGRMFLRDKGLLTKGEREIIHGIYKNRGDLYRDPAGGVRSEYAARSHQDAWLVGKQCRVSGKPGSELPPPPAPSPCPGAWVNGTASADHWAATPRACLSEGGHDDDAHSSSSVTCVLCLNERHRKAQQQQQQPLSKKQKKMPVLVVQIGGALHPFDHAVSGKGNQHPAAPPSSPDEVSSKCSLMLGPRSTAVHPPYDTKRAMTPLAPDQHLDTGHTRTSADMTFGDKQAKTFPNTNLGNNVARTSPDSDFDQKPSRTSPHRSQGSNLPDPDTKTSERTGGTTSRQEQEGEEACGHSERSQDSDDSKRRLHVNVYLPQIAPEASEDDLRACLLQGRPVLARERPLSQHDLQPRQKEPSRQDQPDQQPGFPIETSENGENPKDHQYHRCSGEKEPCLTPVDGTRVDSRDQSISLTNNKVSGLSAEIEDWTLLDE